MEIVGIKNWNRLPHFCFSSMRGLIPVQINYHHYFLEEGARTLKHNMAPKEKGSGSGSGRNKGQDDSRSRKKFESKLKVKAKEEKVTNHVMERFFKVVKPKREVQPKNFQGFPMNLCVYREEMKDHVYCPPGYGSDAFSMMKKDWDFCSTCCLCPCLVVEKEEEIRMLCGEVSLAEETSTLEMLYKATCKGDELMEEVFGARYVRKTPIPKCLREYLEIYFDELRKINGETWDAHPDDELVMSSEDAKEAEEEWR